MERYKPALHSGGKREPRNLAKRLMRAAAMKERDTKETASAGRSLVEVSLATIYEFLTDPALPPKILAVSGAIATLIVMLGIGIWGVRGGWTAFWYLVHLH